MTNVVTDTNPDGADEIKGTPVPVEESVERWSEFRLADGSVVRAKLTCDVAVRSIDEFDEDGNPVYFLRGTIVVMVRKVPDELRRPGEEKS